jgi:hypothetical protein
MIDFVESETAEFKGILKNSVVCGGPCGCRDVCLEPQLRFVRVAHLAVCNYSSHAWLLVANLWLKQIGSFFK